MDGVWKLNSHLKLNWYFTTFIQVTIILSGKDSIFIFSIYQQNKFLLDRAKERTETDYWLDFLTKDSHVLSNVLMTKRNVVHLNEQMPKCLNHRMDYLVMLTSVFVVSDFEYIAPNIFIIFHSKSKYKKVEYVQQNA